MIRRSDVMKGEPEKTEEEEEEEDDKEEKEHYPAGAAPG
jgi:hypothetical protein